MKNNLCCLLVVVQVVQMPVMPQWQLQLQITWWALWMKKNWAPWMIKVDASGKHARSQSNSEFANSLYRSSPPLDPPNHGQLAFLPTRWPHFQTQPCTTCTYVVKSQAVWENARWGRRVCAFGHSGTVLHPFARQMVHPQTCSNPAAFQNFSCSCMMIRCCDVGLRGGGREGVFRGWPCCDRIRVRTQGMRYLRKTCMLSSQTKSEGCGQSNQI